MNQFLASVVGRPDADKEIFDMGDPYHQRFAKTLRDQDSKK